MAFNGWRDFEKFETGVKDNYRFIHSHEVKQFLENIKETLPPRRRHLPIETILSRSQIGYARGEYHGQSMAFGFPYVRMKPDQNNVQEGRANPKGMAYLYLANDEATCMAELRPHKGQLISLARFRISRDLFVVDCYSVQKLYNHFHFLFEPPQSQSDFVDHHLIKDK